MSAGNLVDMVEAMEEKVPLADGDSSHLRRMDTNDSLSRYIQIVGENSAAIHDRPKKKQAKWFEKQSDLYGKTVSNTANATVNWLPAQISDWCELELFPNPMRNKNIKSLKPFIDPYDSVLVDIIALKTFTTYSRELLRAGPREEVVYNPKKVKAAIVTCGGLCPGLNSVIREIYMSLKRLYDVEHVYGIPYGYQGFYNPAYKIEELTDECVRDIHHEGGSVLGSSRGGHDTKMICDAIEDFRFNQIYVIGGDGTHRGLIKLFEEFKKRKVKISVIGIPKTIDNDIALIDRSFGFETAVQEAQRAIISAKTEAISAFNGIGLVKLMGRHSGHIAMYSVLASRDVDVCLIPEIKFVLGGPRGLLAYIKKRLKLKGHAVIVLAEGAGEKLLVEQENAERDASGNLKLPDVGLWLKDQITDFFKAEKQDITLKYIDPTYMIRTVPPNATDNLYCSLLGQNAVHGAFAGYTGFTAGLVNNDYVYIPIEEISSGRLQVDVASRSWHRVIATTGQPKLF